MKAWDEPSTLALLALLIGIALGTLSGYTLALDAAIFTVDNHELELRKCRPTGVARAGSSRQWP